MDAARRRARVVVVVRSRSYRGASRVAVLSPGFKRMLIERGVPEEKIAVVANWAQEGIFKPEPPDPVLARELGMAGWFNVVYSGNLGHFQGLDCARSAPPQSSAISSGSGS